MSKMLWLPPNGSFHGAMIDHLLIWNLAALGALLVLAHLLLLYALLRRQAVPSAALAVPQGAPQHDPRATGQPSTLPSSGDLPHRPFGSLLPTLWSAETIPLLLCCLLFAAMAISSERLWATLRYSGPAPEAMQVEVVGVQFQWYFRYPGTDARFGAVRPALVNAAAGNPLGLDPQDTAGQDDVVSSELLLPAGREVDLRLRAHDVIHGFFIPGMRLKENAVPGLELHVHFTPLTPGSYPILCTQICGSGHARMQAVLRVVPAQEFVAWITAREPQAAATQGATR